MPSIPVAITPPRRSLRPAILATALLAASTLLITPTQAALIDVATTMSTATRWTYTHEVAQTVTMQQSGLLTRVDLDLRRFPGPGDDDQFFVEIRELEENGIPSDAPNSVLYSSLHDAATLPRPTNDLRDLLTTFDLSEAGVEMSIGERFAIVVHWVPVGSGSARGGGWTAVSDRIPEQTFRRPSSNDPWNLPNANEVVFQTWVEPTESAIQLIVDRDTGEVILAANDMSTNGIQLFSPSAGLIPGDIEPNIPGMIVNGIPTDEQYAEVSFSNQLLDGEYPLGSLYNTDLDAMDIEFEYIRLGVLGTSFVGDVEYLRSSAYYVPEPGTLVVWVGAAVLLLRRRTRSGVKS